MISGTLVSIGMASGEVPPEQYEPEDASCFAVQCFLRVGTSSGLGTQDQRLLVCSPTWLVQAQPPQSVLRGQGLLLMHRYSGQELRNAVRRFVELCIGDTAGQVFARLARLGFSEFEDYSQEPLPRYFMDVCHERDSLNVSN
jgi:hypothetical protein